jgi:hypothetical protein
MLALLSFLLRGHMKLNARQKQTNTHLMMQQQLFLKRKVIIDTNTFRKTYMSQLSKKDKCSRSKFHTTKIFCIHFTRAGLSRSIKLALIFLRKKGNKEQMGSSNPPITGRICWDSTATPENTKMGSVLTTI